MAPSATTTRVARASRRDPGPRNGWATGTGMNPTGDGLDPLTRVQPTSLPDVRQVRTGDDHAVTVRQFGDACSTRGVLLLHGLSQQAHFWDPVISRLRTSSVAAIDLRGHGSSDLPIGADFSIPQVADDVWRVADALDWSEVVIVGHSWGAAVTVAAATARPQSTAAIGLIDGGLWSMRHLGPRDDVREVLTPPRLAIPEDEWDTVIRSGSLGPYATDEVLAALRPTFTSDGRGHLTSTIGFERHMAVLDGLLDYDAEADLDQLRRSESIGWAVVCDERITSPWQGLKDVAAAQATERGFPLIHRWAGALHDVPLQWPDLVAGWIDSLAASVGFEGRPPTPRGGTK